MDMINAIIDSLIRGTLLAVSLVLCGFGIYNIFSFLVKMTRKLYNRISSATTRK